MATRCVAMPPTHGVAATERSEVDGSLQACRHGPSTSPFGFSGCHPTPSRPSSGLPNTWGYRRSAQKMIAIDFCGPSALTPTHLMDADGEISVNSGK